jgi:hypothetical protein
MKAIKTLLRWIVYVVIVFAALLGIVVLTLNAYKDEILAKVNEKLQESVEGEVKIGDFNASLFHSFPHLSLTLKDIYVHGPRYAEFQTPVLKAERVHVNIVARDLLRKEVNISSIDIEDGEIFIFKTRTGYSNMEAFKSRKAGGRGSKKMPVVDLHQINLDNVKFTFHDSLKFKHLGVDFHRTENLVSDENGAARIQIRGSLTFHGLMLNGEKGSFLRDVKANAALDVALDSTFSLAVNPSTLAFDKTTLAISGNFHLRDDKQFELAISSDNADHQEALHIVHDTLASKLGAFTIEKPIKIKIGIKGVMQPGVKPAVTAEFSLEDSKATAGKLSAEHLTLEGTFINHVNTDVPNDDNNARLHFEKFKGAVDHMPVVATVMLTDMKDPRLDLKAVFDTPLKDLNANFDSAAVKFKSGHFHSEFTYSGKLSEYLDESVTKYEGKLQGQASIKDGALNYNRRDYRFKNVNAVFDFNEKLFSIKTINLSVNENNIAITGAISDFIPFFVKPTGTTKLKLSVVSPRIDLTGFTKPRIAVSKKRAKAKMEKAKDAMYDILTTLNESLDLNVSFNIAQFVNRNFKASELKGQLLLANNQLEFKDLSMKFGGGSVYMNTRIEKIDHEISPIILQAKAKDVELKSFFTGFNNFNQKTFTNENIEGRLTLDIDLNSALDEHLNFHMKSLNGQASFSIENMRLIKFEPIQRLANFLTKGRDLSDISFNEINSSIDMHGTKMKLEERMEIQSTAITMFIAGIYDLGDSTDLAIQVPLTNLKSRNQEIPPENVGTDSKVGPSVFLRVRPGKDGKTSIAYDPFKKFRKDEQDKKDKKEKRKKDKKTVAP